MEIPEYPPDIQNIDNGFESLTPKSHHESDLKMHKKNTLQAIDDQKEYLSSQLNTNSPPREQEQFLLPVFKIDSDVCPECHKAYKSATGKFCSYCGTERGMTDKQSLLMALSDNIFNP